MYLAIYEAPVKLHKGVFNVETAYGETLIYVTRAITDIRSFLRRGAVWPFSSAVK